MSSSLTKTIGTLALITFVCGGILALAMSSSMCGCAKKESYKKCICSSGNGQGQAGRDMVCQDTVRTEMAYDDNSATEFRDFPSKGWSTVSPGDVDFPRLEGCNYTAKNNGSNGGNQWAAWDFDTLYA